MKYLSVVLFAVVLAAVVIVACKKDEKIDPEAEGKKAGTEMCGCVSTIAAPVIPSHPSSPLPPAGFNPQNPDLSDPATLAYLSDPAIVAYFAAVQAVYETYFAELGGCAGLVANKYQKYFIFSIANYKEELGLFSAFDFIDKDFERGFLEATKVCAEAFEFR
jgi:hypothetical protein